MKNKLLVTGSLFTAVFLISTALTGKAQAANITDSCQVTAIEDDGNRPFAMVDLYCDSDLVAKGGVAGGFDDNRKARVSGNYRALDTLNFLRNSSGKAKFEINTNYAGIILAIDGQALPEPITPKNANDILNRKISSPVSIGNNRIRLTFTPEIGRTVLEPLFQGINITDGNFSLKNQGQELVVELVDSDIRGDAEIPGIMISLRQFGGDHIKRDQVIRDSARIGGHAAEVIKQVLIAAGAKEVNHVCKTVGKSCTHVGQVTSVSVKGSGGRVECGSSAGPGLICSISAPLL